MAQIEREREKARMREKKRKHLSFTIVHFSLLNKKKDTITYLEPSNKTNVLKQRKKTKKKHFKHTHIPF